VWIALAWLRLEAVAWADDPLAQARKAVAESDYAAALPALVAALDAGGHGRDELAEIYQLTGVVEAALGDTRAATDAFLHLLVVSPAAALPDGTSPKIRRPFDEAARYVASHGTLQIKFDRPDPTGPAAVIVASDPLDMVATVRVVSEPGGRQDLEVISERIAIPAPGVEPQSLSVTVLDVHGNALAGVVYARDLRARAPAVPPRSTIAVRAPVRPRPVYLRWWPYAAAAVVAAGATAYFGLAARSATDELHGIVADSANHTYGEARAVEDRARRDVLITNIGLGAAGALAIAAGALYLIAPREHTEIVSGVAPLPGGGQLVVGGKF
jgi:hypothetical protein